MTCRRDGWRRFSGVVGRGGVDHFLPGPPAVTAARVTAVARVWPSPVACRCRGVVRGPLSRGWVGGSSAFSGLFPLRLRLAGPARRSASRFGARRQPPAVVPRRHGSWSAIRRGGLPQPRPPVPPGVLGPWSLAGRALPAGMSAAPWPGAARPGPPLGASRTMPAMTPRRISPTWPHSSCRRRPLGRPGYTSGPLPSPPLPGMGCSGQPGSSSKSETMTRMPRHRRASRWRRRGCWFPGRVGGDARCLGSRATRDGAGPQRVVAAVRPTGTGGGGRCRPGGAVTERIRSCPVGERVVEGVVVSVVVDDLA